MTNDFSINPNINMNSFNNSISEFNQAFSNSLNNASIENANSDFAKIFNSMSNEKPISAAIEYSDNSKIENISPQAKLASDIGKGFSNSLNELNNYQRKAEQDFETLASGGDISIHDVMISAQKSSLAMQMAIQLRGHIINAYNEFRNMSV